ncbi:tRNA pseudouridine(38-40) synthase TruA [Acrocarpospora catenulata]|uniref:tRNA pseudouridine(38-40) synthase TruA n=1 Tax=Acrocarpospora catenulata TaxID=2836182 RepID=UPI001BDB1F0C|nr:tRNA pseudouridine(38-40) synthase TruA [Acrocarpospora catenulata]
MLRLRLDLGYDGTDFSGWAKQPGLRTVQGEIEQALGRVLRVDPPSLTVAGRTDAGVHARGQVAHVDVDPAALETLRADEPLAGLVRRLSGVLPLDVRVRRVSVAPDGFDARFSALFRRYGYRVADTLWGVDPLRRRDVFWHNRPLDVDLLNAASVHLLGEHDFAAFCRKREGATTIRELRRLDWQRTPEGLIVATLVADAFCHSMVRALVGSLLPVGEGRRPTGWPAEALARAQRDSAIHVAPAHGLTLEEVAYPPDDELATQASLTRRVRTLTPPA